LNDIVVDPPAGQQPVDHHIPRSDTLTKTAAPEEE